MERRVLVLGGAGLVGTAIVRSLLASPFALIPLALDRREPPERVPGVEYVIGDDVNIFDPEFMLGLVKKFDPMVVIDAVNIASLASRSGDLLGMVNDYVLRVIHPIARMGVVWIDIGTVATGGMGVEIRFTHSEATDGNSIPHGLVLKNNAASIHGGLLDLLGRTPNFRVGRVVPRAMIGFEPPTYGPIHIAHLGGVPRRYLGRFVPINDLGSTFFEDGGVFCEVGDRTGENGQFGLEETAAITAIGQMEVVTAEAVAAATMDVLGRLMANSGTFVNHELHPDPTSFAVSRCVLKKMADLKEEHGEPSVCFGNLGPLLTKELWELRVLAMYGVTPDELAENDFELKWARKPSIDTPFIEMARILPTIGVPVFTDTHFMPACATFSDPMAWKGFLGMQTTLAVSDVADQLQACREGRMWFVDLRRERLAVWSERARAILHCTAERSHLPLSSDKPIQPGGFWAAHNITEGHGRQAYSAGCRH
jgi:hypothetical protein